MRSRCCRLTAPRRRLAQMSAGAQPTPTPNPNDDLTCDYWKYWRSTATCVRAAAAVLTTARPARRPRPPRGLYVRHPADGKDYIVSYRDCCGKPRAGDCLCTNTVGEMPLYRTQLDSDLIWCFGARPWSTTARRPDDSRGQVTDCVRSISSRRIIALLSVARRGRKRRCVSAAMCRIAIRRAAPPTPGRLSSDRQLVGAYVKLRRARMFLIHLLLLVGAPSSARRQL